MDFTDMRNLAVFDGEVAVGPRIARAIDQSAAVNDNVEFSHIVSPREFSSAGYITGFLRLQDIQRDCRTGETETSML